jgi:hypothetical protein
MFYMCVQADKKNHTERHSAGTNKLEVCYLPWR